MVLCDNDKVFSYTFFFVQIVCAFGSQGHDFLVHCQLLWYLDIGCKLVEK